MRSLRWIAVLSFITTTANAAVPSFNSITSADYDKIVKELSANFAYSSVTPASSLGGLWGFEFGLVGGLTKTPEILALVKKNNSTFDQEKFPHGGAMLRVGIPLGFTAEAIVFPKRTISSLKIGQTSGAAQWTITDVFFSDLPVNLALKGFYSKTTMSYGQVINNSTTANTNVNATISFDDTLYGGQFLVSKKLLVFEPYLGLGYVHAKGDLGISAATAPNASFFAAGGSSASTTPTSGQLLAGLDIKLFFFTLGAEYQRAFGTSSYNGRVSFRF